MFSLQNFCCNGEKVGISQVSERLLSFSFIKASFDEPYTINIYAIFHLCMESNAYDNVVSRFLARTPSMICSIVRHGRLIYQKTVMIFPINFLGLRFYTVFF